MNQEKAQKGGIKGVIKVSDAMTDRFSLRLSGANESPSQSSAASARTPARSLTNCISIEGMPAMRFAGMSVRDPGGARETRTATSSVPKSHVGILPRIWALGACTGIPFRPSLGYGESNA